MPGLFSRISSSLPSTLPTTPFPRLRPLASWARRRVEEPDALDELLLEGTPEMRAVRGGVGGLTFVTSGYFVLLIVMAAVFNRITALVRRPHPAHLRRSPTNTNIRQFLTSPTARRLLRLPTALLLAKSLVRLSIVLYQVSSDSPEKPWFVAAKTWEVVGRMEMDQLCWDTFRAVCCTLACGHFLSAIENRPMVGTGFNLVGYAFMLHLYSSRLSHSIDATADGRPSRPSSHILFSMWLAVLELEWIHLSEFSSEWGRRRLIPTGFCSLLGLTHFFYNLYTKPYRLPSYSFMSTLVTSALLGIVALTATLNGLTSLFTTGTIDIQHLLPHSSSLPDMSEEFDLAIMRLGTACLESTKMTGLGNELNTVNFPLRSYLDVPATSSQTSSLLSAFSATSTSISVPSPSSNQNPWSNRIYNVPTPSSTSLPTTPGINCSNSPYLTHLTRLCSTLIRFSLGLGWWLLGFVPGGRAGVRLLGRIRMRYWRWGVWRVEMLEEQEGDAVVEEGSQESKDDMAMEGILEEIRRGEGEEDRQEEEDVYQLFLEGSTFDGDDSDSSFTPHSRHSSRAGSRSRSCSVSSSTSSSSSSTIQGHRSSQRSRTTFDEYDDDINLPLSLPSSPTLQTHLLAHLLQPTSSSPLTRNRYALIAPTPAQPATLSDPSISSSISSSFLSPLEATIRERRQHHPTQLGSIDEDEESERERRSACIICATAAREVVTIPCLCLTLCEDCRSNLASRGGGANAALCVACRTPITGYSRIFIP